MRTHTQAFKDGIKQYGRQFNDTIHTGYNDGQDDMVVIVQSGRINRVNYSVDTTLLKSVMQTLEVELATKLDDRCKVLAYTTSLVGVNNSTIEYKHFNIEKVEEKKDTKSYVYTCYDNMIKAMVDYETPKVNGVAITYPITIRDYLIAICSHLGLTFKNASDTFTNYNKQVTSEHYIDSDGNKMGYTFRDVLDDIAEAVGGFICIDNLGQLEIRYISNATSSKNLLAINKASYGSRGLTTTYDFDTGKLHTSGTTTQGWPWVTEKTTISIPSGTTLTFSQQTKKSFVVAMRLYYNDSSYENCNISANSLSKTITTTHDIVAFAILLDRGGNVSVNEDFYLQLELGNQATDFEPYRDTINEDYFSDKNVNIGKKVGAYNTLVLSRASDSDNIHRPTTLPQEPIELKISDNAILDQDNREDFIDGIFNQINGLEFYLNDFATTGILYYEIGDKYNVSIGDTIYPCLMLSDDIKRTTGLKENIVTKEPKQSVTDYKYSSTTDKVEISSRNAKILVDKANASIEQIVEAVGDNGEVTSASIVTAINNDTSQIKLDADKVDIEANDVLNILAGNEINLTSKNISINSNNFSVDTNGNMSCSNATINDGNIEIIDNGTQQQSDSHIIISSTNDNKRTYITSNVVDMFESRNIGGTNYVIRAKYYPGYSNISYESEDYSDSRYTTQDYSNLYCNLTRNGHTNYSIYGSQIIRTQYDGNTTFEVDTDTGNTTIGGNITASGKLEVGSLLSGTWTPTLSNVNNNAPSVTYTTRNGYYYKIGNLIFIDFYIRGKITALNSGDYACIRGLPFTSLSHGFGAQPLTLGVLYNCVTNETSNNMVVDSNLIRIQAGNGANATIWKVTSSGNFQIGGSGWYSI